MSVWAILEIEPINDIKAIKRAYSKKLKQHKPDVDPDGYQRVREAYEQALKWAKSGKVANVVTLPIEVSENDADAKQSNNVNKLNAGYSANDVEIDSSDTYTSNYNGSSNERDEKQFDIEKTSEHVKQAEELFDYLFKIKKHGKKFAEFRRLLSTDAFINLETREHFSKLWLETLLSWPEAQLIPGELAFFMAEEFGWFKANKKRRYGSSMDFLAARMEAYAVYKEVIVLEHNGRASEDYIYACHLLTGAFNPKLFKWEKFKSKYDKYINHCIDRLLPYVQSGLLPNINSDSFDWWLSYRNKTPLNLKVGFFSIFLYAVVLFILVEINGGLYSVKEQYLQDNRWFAILVVGVGWLVILALTQGVYWLQNNGLQLYQKLHYRFWGSYMRDRKAFIASNVFACLLYALAGVLYGYQHVWIIAGLASLIVFLNFSSGLTAVFVFAFCFAVSLKESSQTVSQFAALFGLITYLHWAYLLHKLTKLQHWVYKSFYRYAFSALSYCIIWIVLTVFTVKKFGGI